MDALLWKRIGDLFDAARQLSGEERSEFLREQCGDDQSLYDQVLSLLDADGQHGMLDSRPTVSSLPVPNVVAGRFRIVRYIAEGGMGTVYEAEDLQLHEHVALKTIRPDIALDTLAVERFKREILLGKSVTHPNVCRIHDLVVDYTDAGAEVLYLSMQYLDGETLAARIRRGPVPATEALPLVEDMAEALSAAHQADVIHRDFKSGNVMLVKRTDRTHAVVTDFGLARPARDNDQRSLTRMAGTVDYMAPEQIKGEQLTPAADIYAFGVVMYEMVTGQRPFIAEPSRSVVTKHLEDEPRPPRELVPKLDANWNETILDCLRKAPSDRFQSATDVKAALDQEGARIRKHVRGQPLMRLALLAAIVVLILAAAAWWTYRRWFALPEQKHIAVLPFENIGNDAANLPFNDGVVEVLTSKLSQLERYQRSFWVVPSSDTRHITSLEDAYRRLNVTLAVTGSVQHIGKGVIVTVNLVDSKSHKQLSSRTIRASSIDLDLLQDKVWEAVADMVDLEVDTTTVRRLAMGGTKQPEAYGLYIQGVGYLKDYAVDQAIGAFTGAVARDPQYGDAYAGLGDAYATKYFITKDPQWIEKATDNVRQAIALKDTSAPVYVALGKIYERTGRLDEALAEFRRALDEDPASSQARYHMGEVYAAQGKTEEAATAYQAVISRWPQYWLGYSGLGALYYTHGKFAEAVQQFRTVIDLAPENLLGYYDLGGSYIALGKYDAAIQVLKEGLGKSDKSFDKSLDKSAVVRQKSDAWSNLGAAYMYLGRQEEAINAMQEATTINPHNHVLWRNLADSYNQVPSRSADARTAYEKALDAAQAQLRVNSENVEAISGIALYDAHLGRKTEAEGFMAQALSLSPEDSDVLFTSGLVYEIIGNRTKALKALEDAVSAGYSLEEVEKEPELRNLRSDSRYQGWLRKHMTGKTSQTTNLHDSRRREQIYATPGLRRSLLELMSSVTVSA